MKKPGNSSFRVLFFKCLLLKTDKQRFDHVDYNLSIESLLKKSCRICMVGGWALRMPALR
ncbi:MAG: hypothetical protein KatS3mg029_0374 [Saprospiraceae bacterium]|nr:MAG: hypothetical protein KatS3mg029_0374 [Saprospiraceae bacterium]